MHAPASKNCDPRPIGMFDSGLGGLTVMKQLVRALPNEHVIYFGDTARIPYGSKSRETVVRYSIENSIFLIEKEIKVLVVACNTATSHALDKLRNIFSLPVVGVVDPGAEHAVNVTAHGRIAVLGTKGTILSQAYQKAILLRAPHATVVPIACPLFVHLVEEGCIDHPAAGLVVQEYLKPLKGQNIDTILLGCTHYPLLTDLIRKEMGPDVAIVDSATSCAEKVATLLGENHLKNGAAASPTYQYFVSDDPAKFQSLGQAFLGTPIGSVHST